MGQVETDVLKPGLKVNFAPVNTAMQVKSVKTLHEALSEASSGGSVGFRVKTMSFREIVIMAMLLVTAKQDPSAEASDFTAYSEPSRPNQVHSSHSCKLAELREKIDHPSGKNWADGLKFMKS